MNNIIRRLIYIFIIYFLISTHMVVHASPDGYFAKGCSDIVDDSYLAVDKDEINKTYLDESAGNQNLKLTKITARNVDMALQLAGNIFPEDYNVIMFDYVFSLVPKRTLPLLSKNLTAVELSTSEYFVLSEQETKRILGITGLYSVKGKKEVWLGWFGVAPEARGKGYGKTLLSWSIDLARQKGFDVLRLWTSSSEDYRAANILYLSFGFERQDLGVGDPAHPGAELILYSLGLNGQKAEPFVGSLQEALLGAPPEVFRFYKINQ